jgi:hypothetical protein
VIFDIVLPFLGGKKGDGFKNVVKCFFFSKKDLVDKNIIWKTKNFGECPLIVFKIYICYGKKNGFHNTKYPTVTFLCREIFGKLCSITPVRSTLLVFALVKNYKI